MKSLSRLIFPIIEVFKVFFVTLMLTLKILLAILLFGLWSTLCIGPVVYCESHKIHGYILVCSGIWLFFFVIFSIALSETLLKRFKF